MLMLNAAGKSAVEAVDMLKDAIASDEWELKILIDSPSKATELKKFLETKGFSNIVPEDDEGSLYLSASRSNDAPALELAPDVQPQPAAIETPKTEPDTIGVLISGEHRKHRAEFMHRVLKSLIDAETTPNVLALMDGAVSLAAYDSNTCDALKKLEAKGVRVIVSSSCSDRLGMTEALGAGIAESMSEVLDEIFRCGKVITL